MRKIKFGKKAWCQALAAGAGGLAVFLIGLSQQVGIGQSYQTISINGQAVACTTQSMDVKEVLQEARRELASETDARLCMDYDWSSSTTRTPFQTLLSEDELKEALKGILEETVVHKKERVYTVAIEDYRANLASMDEVLEFLDAVKEPADENAAFCAEVFRQEGAHISGILTAVLVEKDAPVAEEEAAAGIEAAAGTETPTGIEAEAGTEMPTGTETVAGTETLTGEETAADVVWSGINAAISRIFENAAAAAESQETETQTAESQEEAEGGTEDTEQTVPEPQIVTDGSLYQTGILDMEFVEKVEVYQNYVDASEISDIADEVIEVTKEKESNKIYVVESGDCLSVIALDHDTTVSSIVALNGLANADSIREGQELIIAVPEPDLKLRVTKGEVYEEDYTADPTIIENDSWYTTKEVVHEEGTTGHRERNDVVVYENGMETSRNMIYENIMVESQPAVIERGTIIPPTYIKPIAGGRFTSGFGYRWGRLHKGVDWACPVGTTVYASSAGTVIQAGYNGNYGYSVVISHPDGRMTRYAHNSKVLVSVGQHVEQGETIALSGSTGRSTGPHVHFEIYINGVAVNPLKYIGS